MADIITGHNAFIENIKMINDHEEAIKETERRLSLIKKAFEWEHFDFDEAKSLQDRIEYLKMILGCETFWHELDSFVDFDDRLEFVRTTKYDIIEDSQPDAVLSRFYDFGNKENASKVANVFIEKFGKVIMCLEASDYTKRFQTIIDTMEESIAHLVRSVANNIRTIQAGAISNEDTQQLTESIKIDIDEIQSATILCGEFRKKGAAKASMCDARQLIGICYQNNISVQGFEITYDYEAIKRDNAWISEEIASYLFQPKFINKWINHGNELEDYLN